MAGSGESRQVRVVVVHRNQPEACRRAVERYAHQGVQVDITVVDNGSMPEARAALHRLGPVLPGVRSVEVVELNRNAGFGPGANAGLTRWLDEPAGSEWAVVAPHDALLEVGGLERLLDVLDARPDAGLACADVGDGATPRIDPYFGAIPGPATVERGWEPAAYPHGTMLLARRACLREVGVFDERFFAYCEEADLALRAALAGWQVGLVRGVMVENPHLGTSVPIVDYLQHRNTLLMVREMSGRYHAAIRLGIAVLQLADGLARPRKRPLVFSARARVLALRDFLAGRYGPPPPSLR